MNEFDRPLGTAGLGLRRDCSCICGGGMITVSYYSISNRTDNGKIHVMLYTCMLETGSSELLRTSLQLDTQFSIYWLRPKKHCSVE